MRKKKHKKSNESDIMCICEKTKSEFIDRIKQ